jgi:hypothetical protein
MIRLLVWLMIGVGTHMCAAESALAKASLVLNSEIEHPIRKSFRAGPN